MTVWDSYLPLILWFALAGFTAGLLLTEKARKGAGQSGPPPAQEKRKEKH
jgi:H+/Cl- antiporter ClcA